MTMKKINEVGVGRARDTIGQMARQEFWVVAKSFFAPVYGTILVLRQLMRWTNRIDERPRRYEQISPAE
ncbi:hypothetical protein [Sphingomonas sp.]|uniref:hypothetical protein n=1 Tax=Sphingomonas sp. TaxID=28214 RepID=UPI001B2CF677|nr:hypothetical protein [Sphingomonas sp.]MBO9711415.1 hypothetical protein [Sphingomonas sp.]